MEYTYMYSHLILYNLIEIYNNWITDKIIKKGHRGSDRMVVEFITTYAISAYHY
jgi:hypothetical protein